MLLGTPTRTPRTAAKVTFEQRDGQSADLAQVGGGEQACESPQAPVGGLGNGKQTAIVAAHTGCYGLESFAVSTGGHVRGYRHVDRVNETQATSSLGNIVLRTSVPGVSALVSFGERLFRPCYSGVTVLKTCTPMEETTVKLKNLPSLTLTVHPLAQDFYHTSVEGVLYVNIRKFYKSPPSNARYIIAVLAVLSTLKKLTFVTRPGKYVRLSATGIERIKSGYVSSLTPLVSNLAYKEVRVFIADNNYISSILNLEGSDFIKTFNVLSLRKNNLKTVIDLDKNLVCMTQRVWTDYIYYIIAGQVALLLLLVSKVSYDYWVFKTTGYLPWPASKMPKMPCDWLFES
uniref:Uncharacterized protein n=1 Tax=Timema shepardi TaxID=629360 RepID=A0A7R9B103_TIMSH|nr:unnamed protein product [Timema shepardi]